MPIPIRTQVITSFLGAHEGMHSTSIPDVFSSADSQNVWMDEYARVRKIDGYEARNATAVTTDTGGSATLLSGLWGYRGTSGGSITRTLVGVFDDGSNEWEIHTSTNQGTTWTFRSDVGSSAAGNIPDFAQFLDDLFIANGAAATPRVWNGSSVSTAGGTQSPTPTISVGAAGNLNGSYEAKLVSIEVNGSRHPGSVASADVLLNNEVASLSWTADSDTDVVGYEVYITTGTGKEFYFTQIVDGRTTTSATVDLINEEILAGRPLEEHGDAPPSCHLIEPHLQRMWYGRTSTDPRRAYYSDPGDPDSTWQDNNFLNFDDDRSMGDFLTALVGGYRGMLLAFMERSVWTVSGTGELVSGVADWNVRRSAASAGSVSHMSVVRVPAGARYVDQTGQMVELSSGAVAYFTPLGDIRIFDTDNDTVISGPVSDTLDTLNYAHREKTFALHDPSRFHITWFFASDSNAYPSEAITWNYRFGIMYNSPTPSSFASGVCIETATTGNICLLGEGQTSNGGLCYELWSGRSFNGSNILAEWWSKPLFGAVSSEGGTVRPIWLAKRFRWVDLVLDSAGANIISVSWFEGFATSSSTATATGSATVSSSAGVLNTADGSDIVTADGGAVVVSGVSANARVWMVDSGGNYMISEAMRMRVFDDSTNPAWTLEGMTLAFQPLPGYRRFLD